MKDLRWRLQILLAASLAGALAAPCPAAERRPNFLLIVADDLGYGDVGCNGCKDVPTPQIDSLAKNGIRLSNAYDSCPVCSPTRAGLLTGRYQQRFGHEFNPGPAEQADSAFGLSAKETTIAERLKTAGYATGMFGKWHLGYKPECHPQKRGFDEFYGFLGGAHSFVAQTDKANPILRGTTPVPAEEVHYTTEDFAAEAVKFIEAHQKEPFFVYLPFNAVHMPLNKVPKYVERFPDIQDAGRQRLAAGLSAMDDAIGSVLAKLREAKLEEHTLVVFVSDNGGPTPGNSSRNGPLSGYKGGVLEGGIRVPFLARNSTGQSSILWSGGGLPDAIGNALKCPALVVEASARRLRTPPRQWAAPSPGARPECPALRGARPGRVDKCSIAEGRLCVRSGSAPDVPALAARSPREPEA